MLRGVGQIVERYAKRLEGCWCHGHTWAQNIRFKRRKEFYKSRLGIKRALGKGAWTLGGLRRGEMSSTLKCWLL
eukprot:8827514-Pyramimonas_sp.AAC.1